MTREIWPLVDEPGFKFLKKNSKIYENVTCKYDNRIELCL